ncbi:hypothetical protein Indivirus_8_3 [Indivirus ILV1]|uniref:Uncharacterized protein n=1 Tax=Indivirus ILV1 TaxID=1977633 RepID=A0A1V0SE71_9VIRU|nr:hypothetical protein Indivirus_8_3 [Indivirus ILV1]
MYKTKYYKYKNKYLDLVKEEGFNDPDKVDAYDSPDLDHAPEEIDDSVQELDNEINENLEEMIMKKENFEGFDTKKIDFVTEDLQQVIIDIGEFGKARGKIYDVGEFDKSLFTNVSKANKNKILELKDKNSFDIFTNRYGKPVRGKLFINWKMVAGDYRGIYIASSVLGDREEDIPFFDKTSDNWLNYDYNRLDDVIIFQKIRDLINFKKITKPFVGKMVDEYAIGEEEFARFNDPLTYDKIIMINDSKSFDKFTNKYGMISNDQIKIDWNAVNHDYAGFYIDKDNDFFEKRSNKAYYQGEKYFSWVEKYNIHKGIVYLFD